MLEVICKGNHITLKSFTVKDYLLLIVSKCSVTEKTSIVSKICQLYLMYVDFWDRL